MNYIDFNVNENKVVKLRLSAKSTVLLERSLGKNPLEIFMAMETGSIPKTEDIIKILHASLQVLEHGYNEDKVFALYDDYVNNGGSAIDMIPIIMEVFQVSGIIPKDKKKSEEDSDEESTGDTEIKN